MEHYVIHLGVMENLYEIGDLVNNMVWEKNTWYKYMQGLEQHLKT